MKKFISFFTSLTLLLSFLCVNAYASSYKDIVLTAINMRNNAYETIESALTEARYKANNNLIYRIYVPAGSYKLMSGLHIYSNTQLYLDKNTVLSRGFEQGNLIKAGQRGELTKSYDGYKNILISGGKWDSGYKGSSCAMRFAHCANLTISDLEVKNINNAHHIEIAAIDGFNLTNCKFSGMKRTNSSSAEAVQIDILHQYDHFPDYYYYDDTPCKNVNVTGCTFTDLYSGIGTRSGVIGSYFENINISSNTFKNISERAISCFNYRNSSINNNTINNATFGIVFEYLPSSGVSTRLFIPNNNKPGKLLRDSLSCINGNTISVNRLISSVDCCGIYVCGGTLDSKEAKEYELIQGNFTVENMSIKSNKITGKHNKARGIFLTGMNDSEIADNKISCNVSAKDGINGINLCAAKRNDVKHNTIQGNFNNGISLYGNEDANSKNNNIASNTIKSMRSYGVRVASGSTASIKSSNALTSCKLSPIYIAGSKYSQNLGKVKIKSISSSARGKALIKWNAVSGASGYKIYRSYSKSKGYKQIATVKGNDKLMFEDKASRRGFTYYYKISPYKTVKSSAVISQPGQEKIFKF